MSTYREPGRPNGEDEVDSVNPDAYIDWRHGEARMRLRWDGTHSQRRGCDDCTFLRGYVSWWCRNKAAIEAHGTALPYRDDCLFWEPCPRDPPPPPPLLSRLKRKFASIL